jgi:hypothetical protein
MIIPEPDYYVGHDGSIDTSFNHFSATSCYIKKLFSHEGQVLPPFQMELEIPLPATTSLYAEKMAVLSSPWRHRQNHY